MARKLSLLIAAAFVASAFASPAAAQGSKKAPPPQLVVTAAVVDGTTLTAIGINFGDELGLVSIGGVTVLAVTSWTDSEVVAELPAPLGPGVHLLTISRGPSTPDLGTFHLARATGDGSGGATGATGATPSSPERGGWTGPAWRFASRRPFCARYCDRSRTR